MKEFNKRSLIKNLLNKSDFIFRFSQSFKIILYINLISLIGCTNLSKNDHINICYDSKIPCLESTEYVLLTTNKGKIKLELYGKLAPLTVGNFVDLVEKGDYDNAIFDRVIREPYPYIIRVGVDNSNKNKSKLLNYNNGKFRYVPLEIKLKANKFPTYGKEIDITNSKNDITLKHTRSSISMARSKEIDSANFDFNILLKSLPELDGRFAVFGKVISGMNVVDSIEEEDFIIKASRL